MEMFEKLRDAILREAEGGPLIQSHDHYPRDDEEFEEFESRFLEENPGGSVAWTEDGGTVVLVQQRPCPAWATIYVGVFQVGRLYGGPEEGGWWYDAGEVVRTEVVRVRFTEDGTPSLQEGEIEFLKELSKKLSEEYVFGTTHRSSMRPRGPDFTWDVSWNVPKDFPQSRPYYS